MMSGLLSTTAKSSMRPPMIDGPTLRHCRSFVRPWFAEAAGAIEIARIRLRQVLSIVSPQGTHAPCPEPSRRAGAPGPRQLEDRRARTVSPAGAEVNSRRDALSLIHISEPT